MLGVRIKIERTEPKVWHDLPRYGRKLILAAVLLSLLFHTVSYLSALIFSDWKFTDTASEKSTPVKIRIAANPKMKKDDLLTKKMIETPQIETKPPKESEYSGPEDHATLKETKLAKKLT